MSTPAAPVTTATTTMMEATSLRRIMPSRPGYGSERRTYPKPRTVWISRGSTSSTFLRR